MSHLSQLDRDQIQQAISRYVQELANDPQSPELLIALGDLYTQQKHWQQAIECYQQVITLKPNWIQAHRHLVQAWTQIGNKSQVANCLEHLYQVFKLEPNSFTPQELYELGQALTAQNRPGKAIACYRAAINSKTDFFDAYFTLGAFLAERGKTEQALEVYRSGIRHNRDDYQYYQVLAQELVAQKKWIWASRNYQKAAKLKRSPEIYCQWGMTLHQLQEYSSAQKCFKQALELKRSPEIYYHWGMTLYQLQEQAPAQECWLKAISLQADYEAAYHQLGLLWEDRQEWEKAGAIYQKILVFNPESAIALTKMGRIYRHLQKYDLAINCYAQAIKYSSEASSPETIAFEGYRETLAEHPSTSATSYFQLANLFRAKSRFDEAIENYQKSIKIDPRFKDAYIALQYVPIAMEKLKDLIDFYRQIVSEDPQITIAWGNLGDALTQEDRVLEAIECYRTGSYQKAIQTYPHLVKLNWQKQKKCGPDFIIAGASKSGTSSIYYYLSCHPQVLLSHKKEIDFYWKNFNKGVDWYLAHFPTITDQDDFLTGEATPNYLRFPQVAQRIKDTFPQTKIIILLRNPADRAISWHYHKINTGLTSQDLASAIAEEKTRLAAVSEAEIVETGFYNPDNILSSLYIYKVRAWMELLGREQFLILKSEDFYDHPLDNMSKVFNFLGLADFPLDNYPQVNAGSYNQVDSELRQTLVDYFTPYNQELEDYLGMEFNWK